MELVNRENNFNKMFSAVPNVGFINPLNASTKVNTLNNNTSILILFDFKSCFCAYLKVKPKSNNNNNNNNIKPKSPQSSFSRLEPIPGIGSPLHDMSLNPNKPLPKKFLS
jgi:hypothetical protein